ncbi:ABC transporter ATP-binding protein [Prauserella rugosa]|uniref:Peptide/nickel transport system ATP-binding protein n=1 Tax=Prauserella rugosa TaxID=43354 RepID=A0A660C7V7_9PSEU|nr:ATP-binding cassette domain-containing protein [Prauserella rugosa]TWH19426.1 peptide/nickel transport system ATP-binding protein [Prauserella rugosa]
MTAPILTVRGLRAVAGESVLLDGIDLDVTPGSVLAVVGRSGSGKTTLGYALQGQDRPGIALSGSVRLHGSSSGELPAGELSSGELLGRTDAERRRLRTGVTAMVPQHPQAVLNPMRRIGAALRELAALSQSRRSARGEAVRTALAAARLDPSVAGRFPHQLSGGQQQRVALAQALITRPGLVVLDEPTAGADPVTTSEIADTLADLVAGGTALVLLTHDLPLARRLADSTIVLHDGRVAERGDGASPLEAPDTDHGRTLVGAEARLEAPAPRSAGPRRSVLVADGVGYRAPRGATLLSDVNLTVRAGACVAIVGRSGAGKTTLARGLAGLTPFDSGEVRWGEHPLPPSARRRSAPQRRHVQYVHQDARGGFDPRRPVTHQIARTAELLRGLPRPQARREAEDLLAHWGVGPEQARRRPEQLSGGQLQRAAVVRALLARPAVLVCDEVTSALDTVTRTDLLTTLADLRSTQDTAVVLISHDLAVVTALAEEVHVLDGGRLVETASPDALLTAPRSRAAAELVTAMQHHHIPGDHMRHHHGRWRAPDGSSEPQAQPVPEPGV